MARDRRVAVAVAAAEKAMETASPEQKAGKVSLIVQEPSPPDTVRFSIKPSNWRLPATSRLWSAKIHKAIERAVRKLDRQHSTTHQVPPGDNTEIVDVALTCAHDQAALKDSEETFFCTVWSCGAFNDCPPIEDALDEWAATLVDINVAKDAAHARQLLDDARNRREKTHAADVQEMRAWREHKADRHAVVMLKVNDKLADLEESVWLQIQGMRTVQALQARSRSPEASPPQATPATAAARAVHD